MSDTENINNDVVEDKKKYVSAYTGRQVAHELVDLGRVYPIARMLNAKDLERDACLVFDDSAPCGRRVCEDLFKNGGECEWSLRIGSSKHEAKARYVTVDGEPSVLLCVSPATNTDDEFDKALLHIDSLTEAFNRRFYEEKLRKQHLYAGVAIVDLDDFKLINDTLGHYTGDLALKTVAKVILECIRGTDMLVRYGGDEFVIVMPNIEETTFSQRLQSINQAISQTNIPGYDNLNLTISIGGVISKGDTVEEALKEADKLMYRAKYRKNSVITDADADASDDYQKPNLLIVDDSEVNRVILSGMLKDEYKVLEVDSGIKAISVLEELGTDISIVLLDIIMPEMDGFEVLSTMSHRGWIGDIPVIMISSEDSDDTVLHAYEQGASDYISRPFDVRVVKQRVSNVMRLYARQRRLSALLAQQYYEREKNGNILVNIMGGAMELRNGESGPHVLHVRNLTEILLDRLTQKTDKYAITGRQRSAIIMASVLHDIGKLAIPDSILNKPGSLTKEEFEIMKTHTTLGSDMLNKLNMYNDSPMLIQVAHDICRWHHERYDGGGYPDGLVGDDIPISAQVVSLADVYDALTSERVYKHAVSHQTAIMMILNGECGVFNPLLLECLLEVDSRILREINVPNMTPPPSMSAGSKEH